MPPQGSRRGEVGDHHRTYVRSLAVLAGHAQPQPPQLTRWSPGRGTRPAWTSGAAERTYRARVPFVLQWVARKRAAVGGTTLLTASWWPGTSSGSPATSRGGRAARWSGPTGLVCRSYGGSCREQLRPGPPRIERAARRTGSIGREQRSCGRRVVVRVARWCAPVGEVGPHPVAMLYGRRVGLDLLGGSAVRCGVGVRPLRTDGCASCTSGTLVRTYRTGVPFVAVGRAQLLRRAGVAGRSAATGW